MTDSKQTLRQAKAHIQAKRYDQARKLLIPIRDNATASRWLAKLDEIDPPRESRRWTRIALVMALVALVILIIVLIPELQSANEQAAQFRN